MLTGYKDVSGKWFPIALWKPRHTCFVGPCPPSLRFRRPCAAASWRSLWVAGVVLLIVAVLAGWFAAGPKSTSTQDGWDLLGEKHRIVFPFRIKNKVVLAVFHFLGNWLRSLIASRFGRARWCIHLRKQGAGSLGATTEKESPTARFEETMFPNVSNLREKGTELVDYGRERDCLGT